MLAIATPFWPSISDMQFAASLTASLAKTGLRGRPSWSIAFSETSKWPTPTAIDRSYFRPVACSHLAPEAPEMGSESGPIPIGTG